MSKHTETGAAVLRTTPLHRVHTALGASFTDFGGWQMPLRYTSDLAEHHAVRRSAGIFDLSHMGEVKVAGPEAGAALDHALVGALSAVAVGRARYTMIVSPSGGVIDDLIVYHVGDEEYLVVPNAGNRERVAAELVARCAGFDCTVEDISLRTCLIAVQGPRAQEVLVGVVESGAAMPGAPRPAVIAAPLISPAIINACPKSPLFTFCFARKGSFKSLFCSKKFLASSSSMCASAMTCSPVSFWVKFASLPIIRAGVLNRLFSKFSSFFSAGFWLNFRLAS